MAGAAEVMAAVDAPRRACTYAALGAEPARAPSWPLAAGVDALTVTVSASPTYNEKNVRMTVDESVGRCRRRSARWPAAGAGRRRRVVRVRLAVRGRHLAPADVRGARARGCSTRARRRSPTPTPPAWPRPGGSTTCSTSPASTSACTCTRRGAPALVNAYAALERGRPPLRHVGRRARRLAVRRRRGGQPGHRGPRAPARRPRRRDRHRPRRAAVGVRAGCVARRPPGAQPGRRRRAALAPGPRLRPVARDALV